MTGTGTSLDPYIISSVTDLQAIDDDLTAYYELGSDIDASATTTWNSNAGFSPIALAAASIFSGNFDGKGYTITDLFIDRTGSVGLFYEISGTVENVGLVDCDITTTGTVGGICKVNDGGTISKCYVTGAIVGGSHTGGVVQWNKGTITNCYSRASLTGDGGNNLAGFVQYNDSTGTIDDCYATGAVTNGGGGAKEAGFCQFNDSGTITNCFWDTETSGEASSDGGTGKTTAEMKTQSTFVNVGWNFTTIWRISDSINDGYPSLEIAEGEKAGAYAVVEERFHYVDAYGVERYVQGTVVP